MLRKQKLTTAIVDPMCTWGLIKMISNVPFPKFYIFKFFFKPCVLPFICVWYFHFHYEGQAGTIFFTRIKLDNEFLLFMDFIYLFDLQRQLFNIFSKLSIHCSFFTLTHLHRHLCVPGVLIITHSKGGTTTKTKVLISV